MSSSKKIDDLLKETQESKLNFDIEMDSEFDELSNKLNNERPISYSDFTDQSIEIINVEEDLAEFDYELPSDDEVVVETIDLDEKNDAEESEDTNEVDDSIENVVDEEANETPVHEDIILEIKEIDDSKAIVEYRDVHLSFGKEEVLRGIDLEIMEGEFVYFIGKSGAGKSSLTKMIYREVVNTTGTIIVDDTNVTNLKQRKLHLLRRKVGVVFQDYKLLPDRTVYENVKYSLDVISYPKNKRKEQTLKTLKLVGIIELKDKYPDELSGGQQQRVAIARAIVDDPKIIVADEPTGNLDPTNALSIMKLLEKINQSGTTVVMATHDVGIVNKFVHRVVSLGDGKVLSDAVGGYKYE